jgi:hypothetical protein
LPAHCRANAVRADKQIATQCLSIGEPGGHTVVVLLEFDQLDASANALFRESVVQHVVEPGPGRTELGHLKLGGDAAVARERYSRRNRDADGAIDPSAGGEKPFQHRRVNPEARAASLEFADRPFDDRHVATRAEQHVTREKPAQRAADDDGAGHFTRPPKHCAVPLDRQIGVNTMERGRLSDQISVPQFRRESGFFGRSLMNSQRNAGGEKIPGDRRAYLAEAHKSD